MLKLRQMLLCEAGGFGLVFLAIAYLAAPSTEVAGCADLKEQVQAKAVAVSPATLVPRERETLVFAWNFKSGRQAFQDSTRLSWDGGPPTRDGNTSADPDALAFDTGEAATEPAAVRPGDILELRMRPPRTADDSRAIPVAAIGYYAVVVEDGVSVKVCVEPGNVEPGVYTSAIRFDDPDIRAAPIGMELTVKENDLRKPLGAAVLGCLIGFMLVTLKWHEVGAPRGTALSVGLIVGVIGVVPPSYALWSDNPVWGSDPFLDLFGLFAATAIGIFGSAAVAEALNPAKPAGPQATTEDGGENGGEATTEDGGENGRQPGDSDEQIGGVEASASSSPAAAGGDAGAIDETDGGEGVER